MTLSTASLVVNDALVKVASAELANSQIIVIRSLVIVLLCALVLRGWPGFVALLADRDLLVRTGFVVANTFAFVAAVTSLPFTIAVLVDYSGLLFVSMLASVLLGERLSARRLTVIVPGIVGCYLILSPEGSDHGRLIVLPVVSALTGPVRDVWTGHPVFANYGAYRPTLHAAIGLCLSGLLVTDLSTWITPTPLALSTHATAGLFQALALLLTAKAFLIGKATLIAPFRPSAVVWTLLISLVAFEEHLGLGQILGVLAVAAALWMTLSAGP